MPDINSQPSSDFPAFKSFHVLYRSHSSTQEEPKNKSKTTKSLNAIYSLCHAEFFPLEATFMVRK